MKFEINTKEKTLTLLEEIGFSEIDKLKKFVGEDWKQWKIKMNTTVVTQDNWYPYYPTIYPQGWWPNQPVWQVSPGIYTVECNGNTGPSYSINDLRLTNTGNDLNLGSAVNMLSNATSSSVDAFSNS